MIAEENPLISNAEEGLEWLELDSIPNQVRNPFLDYPIDSVRPDVVDELVSVFMDTNYLHFAVKHILNIELLPFQLVILDTLWNKRLPMLIGSRGMGKSFILAVYALLRMVFHPGCRVVIVGAAFRQSRQVFEYMTNIWDKAPVLRDIAGGNKNSGPKRDVDRCVFTIGTSVCYAIPIGDGTKIRGLRANYILADEFASIPEDIFNLVVQGFGVVAAGPVDKVKEYAIIKRLKKLGQWSEDLEKLRRSKAGGNQIVYSGTAFYAFNHFCRYFKKWHSIISSRGNMNTIADLMADNDGVPDGFDWKDYAILRVPYTKIPEGWLDPGIVAQARATLHHSQFLMEYGAVFASDSQGFYKRSIIESATTNKPITRPNGERIQFSALRQGDPNKVYIMGVDPAADQDNAAIVILELNLDYRKVVHCWTTNRKRYNKLKKHLQSIGESVADDYYQYIARRIRQLMRVFNIERIAMDKHGGGTAIAEALGSKNTCDPGEYPVFEIVDPEKPKPSDVEKGIHNLELIIPSQELNSEANHGMLKDLQEKNLLFPMFDTIELAKAVELDKANEILFDTYEDLVQEIEELKNEMTTIVVTPSATLGKETFDTPEVKMDGMKKGHLRKDRFSALLYANYYARNKDKKETITIQYKAVGATKETRKITVAGNESMYHGPGMLKFGQNQGWNYMHGGMVHKRK